MHRIKILLLIAIIFGLWLIQDSGGLQAAVLDTYLEDFDSRKDGATIDGVDSWRVTQGESSSVIVQSSLTATGSGRNLKLTGAVPALLTQRSFSYGGLSPTWIHFRVRPSLSAQRPNIPSGGIGAICFEHTGKVLASNGQTWVDTAKSFSPASWYDVRLKLNFKTHSYDLYLTDTLAAAAQFIPAKSNLKFIDSGLNSLSVLKFYGAYSASQGANVYIDDVAVLYLDRLGFITASPKLISGQASGPITLQLQNANSEPQSAPWDMSLELKSTSGKGRFSLEREPWKDVIQIVLPKKAQAVTFYYKDTVKGNPVLTVSEYPDQGITDGTQQLELVSQIFYFDLEAASPQVAGQGFNLKLTAKDEQGKTNESYSGTVNLSVKYLSPAAGSYSLSPDKLSGFVQGVLKATLDYPDSGLVSIIAADADDSSKSGASGPILFLPADFKVQLESPQTVAKRWTLTLIARNARGQTTPNYNGQVNLYPAAVSPLAIPQAVLSPAVVSGAEFQNGLAYPGLTYNLYGTIKIKAEDAIDSTKQGMSSEVTFLPKALSLNLQPPAGAREFFYIGEPIAITVKAEDDLKNPIPNYPGLVELSSNYGLAVPPEYSFTNEDAGQGTFLANPIQAGSYTVTARAEPGTLQAESAEITVKNAIIQVIDAVSPIGTGEVIIQLVDESGRVITSENSLVINLRAQEEVEDGSVILPFRQMALSAGKAIIPVSNSQAEVVTIIPSSEFKIQAKKGSITFGRVAKSGVSTLMWRELKGRGK